MRVYLVFIFSTLLAFFAGLSPASDQDKINNRIQLLKLETAEKKRCLRYRDAGQSRGSYEYRLSFPSCTDFLLAGDWLKVFFPPPEKGLNLEEQCFDSGYRYGYVMENIKQWTPCAHQLHAVIEAANQESMAKCRALAAEEKIRFENLRDHILENSQRSLNSDLSKKYAQIIFFSEHGFGSKVWQELLKLAELSQKEAFSCHYIINQEVMEDSP